MNSILSNPKLLGFIRGIGMVVVYAIVKYIETNIGASGLVGNGIAGIIVIICTTIESHISAPAVGRAMAAKGK